MKDKLVWLLIIALAICIGILVLWPELLPGKDADQQASVAAQQEYGRLAVQLSELTKQQEQIKSEYTQQIKGIGTLTLLFADFGTQFIDELLPAMEEAGLVGTLAFTDTKYPGAEGCLTMEQWQDLQEKGWNHCLYWDGATPLDTWLPNSAAKLLNAGISLPDVLCFAPDTYQAELMPLLERYNITTAVYYPENINDFVSEVVDGELWEIGAMLWHTKGVSAWISQLTAEGGTIVLTVHDEFKLNSEYMSLFLSMMETMERWKQTNFVFITNINEAKAFHRDIQNNQSALETEMEQKLAETQTQIEAITQQMNDLTKK